MATSLLNIGGSRSSTSSSSRTSESGQQTIQRLDVAGSGFLDELYRLFGTRATQGGGFTREQAIEDSAGAIDNLFRQYENTALPQILNMQAQTGGYASSAAQSLANEAYASTVAQGAQLRLDTIANYAALNQRQQELDVNAMLGALGGRLQAREDVSYAGTSNTSSRGRSSSIGFGFNI